MTELTTDLSSTALFNLATSLSNPKLKFPKFKKSLIQHSSNLFKSHDPLDLAPRSENDRPDDLPAIPTNVQMSIYAQDMKEYISVLMI